MQRSPSRILSDNECVIDVPVFSFSAYNEAIASGNALYPYVHRRTTSFNNERSKRWESSEVDIASQNARQTSNARDRMYWICICCANQASLLTSPRTWNIHEACSQPPRIRTNVFGLIFKILRRLDPAEQAARRNRRKKKRKTKNQRQNRKPNNFARYESRWCLVSIQVPFVVLLLKALNFTRSTEKWITRRYFNIRAERFSQITSRLSL